MQGTAYISRNRLHIGSRHYDLTRLTHASSGRIETVLNSESVQKRIELDQGIITIHIHTKAKESGTAIAAPITPPPMPVPPPVVEIPRRRPGHYFLNGVLITGTTGVSPLELERMKKQA